MRILGACVNAVAAGAVTTAVVAGNVAAMPETAAPPRLAAAGVGLTASELPLIDVDAMLGPLRIVRQLVATYGELDAGPGELATALALEGSGEIGWDGLLGGFELMTSEYVAPFIASVDPGGRVDYVSAATGSAEWAGGLTGGPQANGRFDAVAASRVAQYLGGVNGLGVDIDGLFAAALLEGGLIQQTSLGEVGLVGIGSVEVALPGVKVQAFPFDGAFAQFDPLSVDVDGETTILLGSNAIAVAGGVSMDGIAGLCLGSAAGVCGGEQGVYAGFEAPIDFGIEFRGPLDVTPVFAVDVPTTMIVGVLGGTLTVQGLFGGEVLIGSATFGRIVPVDLEIPLGAGASAADTGPLSLRASSPSAASAAASIDESAEGVRTESGSAGHSTEGAVEASTEGTADSESTTPAAEKATPTKSRPGSRVLGAVRDSLKAVPQTLASDKAATRNGNPGRLSAGQLRETVSESITRVRSAVGDAVRSVRPDRRNSSASSASEPTGSSDSASSNSD